MKVSDTVIMPSTYDNLEHGSFKPYYSEVKVALEKQAEVSFKAGIEECSKTHFKPDWEIKAKELKEATEEARLAGIKEVVDWISDHDLKVNSNDWLNKLRHWGIE